MLKVLYKELQEDKELKVHKEQRVLKVYQQELQEELVPKDTKGQQGHPMLIYLVIKVRKVLAIHEVRKVYPKEHKGL